MSSESLDLVALTASIRDWAAELGFRSWALRMWI